MTVFENPFYLLGAGTRDDRWRISALAEEKLLSIGGDTVTAARDALTNPQKRLFAELRWFPGLGKEELANVIGFLNELKNGRKTAVPALMNSGILAALNLRLCAFPLWSFDTDAELKQIILDINRLFEAANAETVKAELNRDRIAAGFLPVSDDAELKAALRIYRDDIRQTLHDKISVLPPYRYLKLVEELFAANQAGGVFDDILAGYELDVMTEVKEQKQQIYILISALKNGDMQSADKLAAALERWNLLVLPCRRRRKEEVSGIPTARKSPTPSGSSLPN